MTTTERDAQRSAALRQARRQITVRSEVRRGFRDGTLNLATVLADPPPELKRVLLVDVLRWAAVYQGATTRMVDLGAMALEARINLMVPLGRASVRTRAWAAEHGALRLQRRPNGIDPRAA
jgi:hypothetical protein